MSSIIKINRTDTVNARPQAQSAILAKRYRSRLIIDSLMTRWRGWVLLLVLTTVFVIAALWSPPDEPQFVLCPFRALTHYPCPGCGMTRAFCALAHGQFWRAIKFNALSPLLFLFALAAWAYAAATVLRIEWMRSLLARRLFLPSPFFGKLMLALVLAWWVIRVAGNF
jgi:hypothetical protein